MRVINLNKKCCFKYSGAIDLTSNLLNLIRTFSLGLATNLYWHMNDSLLLEVFCNVDASYLKTPLLWPVSPDINSPHTRNEAALISWEINGTIKCMEFYLLFSRHETELLVAIRNINKWMANLTKQLFRAPKRLSAVGATWPPVKPIDEECICISFRKTRTSKLLNYSTKVVC